MRTTDPRLPATIARTTKGRRCAGLRPKKTSSRLASYADTGGSVPPRADPGAQQAIHDGLLPR